MLSFTVTLSLNFNKKHKYSSLKHILKIAPNFRLFKKKNYDWFLSKPYLFLNTYKNFKINKHYSNYLVFFIFKKYFRFFNILKRLNFNVKHKKTNNFWTALEGLKTSLSKSMVTRADSCKYFWIFFQMQSNLLIKIRKLQLDFRSLKFKIPVKILIKTTF